MKNLWIFFALVISWNTNIAQETCSAYYPFQEGTKFQITTYDKKDKVSAVVDYLVKESSSDSALLAYTLSDDKNETIATSEYTIICQDDGIAVDFKSLAAPGIMEQYQDMEVEVTGTNLIIPNELLIDRELPDADMFMKIKIEPITMNMSVFIKNRKVSGMETVTTSAGTFDCVVLSYDFETKMGIKISGTAKQWLSKGVGMVKQEDYNKKGKRISRSELTVFEN